MKSKRDIELENDLIRIPTFKLDGKSIYLNKDGDVVTLDGVKVNSCEALRLKGKRK